MKSSRTFGLENLESRYACAGNVFTQIVNRELVISGDDEANYVSVQQQLVGGVNKYVIRGLPFSGQFDRFGDPVLSNDKTTINGFVQTIRIKADGINLFVDTASGNDAVKIGGDGLSGALMTIPRLRVRTGAGDDYLKVEDVRNISPTPDLSTLYTTDADSSPSGGISELGSDKLVIDNLQLSNVDLFIGTGGGRDSISIDNSQIDTESTDVVVFTGDGNDDLRLTDSNFTRGRFSVRMGAGTDNADVEDIDFRRGLIDMGAGPRDRLRIAGLRFLGKATLLGGDGAGDRLERGGANQLGPAPTIQGFE